MEIVGFVIMEKLYFKKKVKGKCFLNFIYFRKINDLVCVLMSRFRVYLINYYSGIVNEIELDFIFN